jgi:hypothetical protein
MGSHYARKEWGSGITGCIRSWSRRVVAVFVIAPLHLLSEPLTASHERSSHDWYLLNAADIGIAFVLEESGQHSDTGESKGEEEGKNLHYGEQNEVGPGRAVLVYRLELALQQLVGITMVTVYI